MGDIVLDQPGLPRFELVAIGDTKRQMVEPDMAFVEASVATVVLPTAVPRPLAWVRVMAPSLMVLMPL